MRDMQMNIKITFPRIDYNLDSVDEILEIDEKEYEILQYDDIEVATRHFPSAIDPGEIFVKIAIFVNEISKEPMFLDLLSAALYDLSKFLLSKSKAFLRRNKNEQKVITMDVLGSVTDISKSSISFDIMCNTENIIDITDKLSKINNFIENNKFKTVNIHYDHSTDTWEINNKCDNNL